ncbi:MAG: Eco57I restriction-modification methylase domain-containing protein, partial [Candidatus Hodarchaeota archaeon]
MKEDSETIDYSEENIKKGSLSPINYLSEFGEGNMHKKNEKHLLEDIKKWYFLLGNALHRTGNEVSHAKNLLICLLFIRLLEINAFLPPKWMQSIYFHWKKEKIKNLGLGVVLRTALQKMFEDYGIDVFFDSLCLLDGISDDFLIEILKKSGSSPPTIKELYKSLNLPINQDNLGIYGHDRQNFSLNTLNVAYEEQFRYKLDKTTRGLILIKKQKKKKAQGAFFTPSLFSQFLVEITLKPPLRILEGVIFKNIEKNKYSNALKDIEEIQQLKILDPACGNGIFLITAFKQIKKLYNRLEKKIKEKGLFDAFEGEFMGIGEKILLNNIFGVDKDPEAVQLTKLNLWLHLLVSEQTRYQSYAEKGEEVKLPPLKSNILVYNSIWQPNTSIKTIDQNLRNRLFNVHKTYREKLTESYTTVSKENSDKLREAALSLEIELQASRGECWNTEIQKIMIIGMSNEGNPIIWPLTFPEVFFRPNPGFDIILTNPPFLAYHSRQTQAISSELLNLFQELYPVLGHKRPNTYLFFLELCFNNLLRRSGRIGFVIDQAFRDLAAYKHVREYFLKNLYIETIVPHIGFPGATVDVSFIIAELLKTSDILKKQIKWVEEPFSDLPPIILEKEYFSAKPNYEFIFSAKEDILRRIEKQPSVPLGGKEGLCNIACGLEYSILLKKYFLSSFKENNTFHPALNGANDIPSRYTLAWYPEKGDSAYVRFNKHYEEELIANGRNVSDTGKAVIFASGDENRYKKPKIIIRQTCAEFCGIIDENKGPYGAYYSLRNTHVINLKENSPVTLPYILGILNSRLMSLYGRERNIIRTLGKNRQPQIRIRDLERIPVILPPKTLDKQCFSFFDKFVKRLSDLKRIMALLGVYNKQLINEKKIIEEWEVISLTDLLSFNNKYSKALYINLYQCKMIEENKKQIPRYYRIIFLNERTLELICKNVDDTETIIVKITFDSNCPNWVKDFLYLSLSAKAGKTNYKNEISLQIPLKERFKIPLPPYIEISKFRALISNFISEIWNNASKDTKVSIRDIFSILF